MNKKSLISTILVFQNGEQIDRIVESTTKRAETKYNNLVLYGYTHPITQKLITNCQFTLL